MVRDGYFYALPLIAAAILLGWLTYPVWAIIPLPAGLLLSLVLSRSGACDSGGSRRGRLSGRRQGHRRLAPVTVGNQKQTRISIFLNVFNVHVNRSPIAGVIRDVRYQRGKYLNAMNVRLPPN